jgi:hypothetical protein
MGYGPRARLVRQHERFFLARVPEPGRSVDNVDGMHKSDGIAGWDWWTLGDLDTTSEAIWPRGLAGLIRGVL